MDLINTLDYCTNLSSGFSIPDAIGNLIHLIIVIIQVVVPLLLIIWGMLDFAKATVGKDDEDVKKKGLKVFMQRAIAAIVVFLIVTLTQLVINAVASVGGSGNEAGTAWTCASELIKGK